MARFLTTLRLSRPALVAFVLLFVCRAVAYENIATNGQASSSGPIFNNYTALNAFDGKIGTPWCVSKSTNVWLSYSLSSPTIVNAYCIKLSSSLWSSSSRAPRSFYFQGFDASSSDWVTLDVRLNESSWQSDESRIYRFANNVAYSAYRLYILASNAGGYVGLAELELHFIDNSDSLTISCGAELGDYGLPSPPYGVTNGLLAGETFICSIASTEPVALADGGFMVFDGYVLYTNDIPPVLAASGMTTSFLYTHSACGRLTWQWRHVIPDLHVAPTGDDMADGQTWGSAKKTLQGAIAAAVDGQSIIVSNGLYEVGASIVISKGVKVRGFAGCDEAVLVGGGTNALMRIANAAAEVSGLTFSNGWATSEAYVDLRACSGVEVSLGVLSNCVIRSCLNEGYGGAALKVSGGVAIDCRIVDNITRNTNARRYYWCRGCAVSITGGELVSCEIANNRGGSCVAIVMTSGLVRDCDIHGNLGSAAYSAEPAHIYPVEAYTYGTVTAYGGLVERCRIVSNTVATAAGAYLRDAAVLRNSLVAWNVATASLPAPEYDPNDVSPTWSARLPVGGVLLCDSAQVENCTLYSNCALWRGNGQGLRLLGGVARNVLAWNNGAAGGLVGGDIENFGGTVEHSFAGVLVAGEGNLAGDPLFVNPQAGDLRLLPGSPCRDAALSLPGVTADINGLERPVGAAPDIGAFEAEAPSEPLASSFTSSLGILAGSSASVRFVPTVTGANLSGLTYLWDFGDGHTSASASPTHTFGYGSHTVSLTVRNEAGECASLVRRDVVIVAPSVTYASPGGGPSEAWPYDSEETASSSIQAAVEAVACPVGARGRVVVLPGVHTNAANDNWVVKLTRPVELLGRDGADLTSVDACERYGRRGVWLSHCDAVVCGLKITGCAARNEAASYATLSCPILNAVYMSEGQMSNVVVSGNSKQANAAAVFIAGGEFVSSCVANNFDSRFGNSDYGGGIRIYGGVVRDCVVTNNYATRGGGMAILSSSALIERCTVAGNFAPGYPQGEDGSGGGIYMAGGMVKNSQIYGNFSSSSSQSYGNGGGACVVGGTLWNVTIADNLSAISNCCAGLALYGGTVRNSIIWFNGEENGAVNFVKESGTIRYSCFPSAVADEDLNIFEDPAFRDRQAHDYSLRSRSACLNAGSSEGWLDGDVDLAGLPRIIGRSCDIGAFECAVKAGAFIILR